VLKGLTQSCGAEETLRGRFADDGSRRSGELRDPKKAASRGRRLFERKVLLGGLALGELEAFAGSGLAGLFALTSTWVTAEKTSGLQHGTKFGVVLNQRAGDRELDGIGLSVHAASMGGRFDVELIL